MDVNLDEELQRQLEKSIKVIDEMINVFQKFVNDLKSESETSTNEQDETAHADPGHADPGSSRNKSTQTEN